MAHTKFILSVDRVLSDEEQLEIIGSLEPIARDYGLTRELDVRKPKLSLEIYADNDPLNPRIDWDNATVMYCRHSRYDLGDKDAEDPYMEFDVVQYDGQVLTEDQYDLALEALEQAAADWFDAVERNDGEALAAFGIWHGDAIRRVYEELNEQPYDTVTQLREDVAICRPLYLYDHSGITISAGSFNDPWDSGQVGWQYITHQKLMEEWGGDETLAKRSMDLELEAYDQYLRGEVYGFAVIDEDGDTVEACSGFFGDDPYENGMADYFPKGITKEMINEALENIRYG